MKNKIYYGEYSLAYWLELMLHEKIVLPDYQRYYVWERSDLNSLVETLKHDRFVPPITIGSYFDGQEKRNLIIDGQQRLTSVLLAATGVFPKKSAWKGAETAVCSGAELDEEEEEVPESAVIEWTYKELLSKGAKSLDDIRKLRDDEKYEPLDPTLQEEFLSEKYMGFCYLVPEDQDVQSQRSYYANVFRDLNVHGKPLNVLDSRRSLYFLKPGMDRFFEPEFSTKIYLINHLTKRVKGRLDFVRYLSLMDEFAKRNNDVTKVAKKFYRDEEGYYTKYIDYIVNESGETPFRTLAVAFKGTTCESRVALLASQIEEFGIPQEYTSQVDMDVTFFGLVYWIVYKGKSLNSRKKAQFTAAYEAIIKKVRNTGTQLQAPSRMKNMRERMRKSVEFFKNYMK